MAINREIGLSIIVCNYNASLENILLTLASCIRQKECNFEVVYCDDGSTNSFEKEIKEYFQKRDFKDYVMACSKENHGTLINLTNGLKVAKYKYCKTIGCGDLFYDELSLKRVIDKFEQHQSDIVITNSCYFFDDEKEIKTFAVRNPIDIKPYCDKTYNPETIKKRLLLNEDLILGASVYANTEYLLDLYTKFIGKIKYTEDALIVYAALFGAKINYVENYCVYYEYGTGISTSGQSEFQKIIQKECEQLYDYMSTLDISKKYLKYLKNRKKIRNSSGLKAVLLKLFVTPSQISIKLKSKRVKKEKPSFEFYKQCKEDR